jgi:hypothetical protein
MSANIREDLEDVIWLLDPMDTWALSNLEKVDASSVYHEWLGDNLAAAAVNRQLEGDDPTYATAAGAIRYGNYCQISRKEFIVSGTLETVNKAGRSSENKRLAVKLMKELKRDMELAIVTNQGTSVGTAVSVRSMAGMESWIAGPTSSVTTQINNVIQTTTTAQTSTTPGFASGGVVAPTDSPTTGALTVGVLNVALNGAWADGGDPRVILVGSTQKAAIDAIPGVATRFVDVTPREQAPIINAANMYVSSFGNHTVILSRYVRSSVVLCLDPDYWAVAFLRRPFVKALAQTGDADKKMLLSEFTLVCRNPNASGKVVACA